MKILITGASGFVGTYLVQNAVALGFEIFAGIIPSTNVGQFDELPALTILHLPYDNKEELKAYLLSCQEQYGNFDYIIHTAGITKCKKTSDFDLVNYQYTKTFVEALMETNCIPQKFIYMSSMGAIGPEAQTTLEPYKETITPHPTTFYGISKLKSELFLQSTTGFPYIIVRPTGIYGPDDTEYNIYVSMIDNGFEVFVGRQPQQICFIYIADLVKILFTMLESKVEGKVYFISDGNSYTLHQYATIIKKYLHKKTIKLTVPLIIVKFLCYSFDILGGWFGKVLTLNADKYKLMCARNLVCDISSLKQDFNFKPDYVLDAGVKETVVWYLNKKIK